MKEARSAAEAAAARARDIDVTRGQVEERLRNEVDGLKQERERLRLAHHAELDQLRIDTDREVRGQVSAAAQAEIAQMRAELESKLASELADVERRRVAALAAIRAQLDGAEAPPAAEAPPTAVAAPASVPREMAFAAPESQNRLSQVSAVLSRAARATGPVAKQAFRLAVVVLKWIGRMIARLVRASIPVVRDLKDRYPRAVPAMAVAVLAFGVLTWLDASSLLQKGGPIARSAGGFVASIYGKAKDAVTDADEQPAESADAEPAVASAAPKAATRTESGPGSVTFFSRVPLEIYAGGRRVGSTDDGQIALPRGRHTVEFVSTRLNYRGEATIDVRAGVVNTHNVFLPAGMLQLETEPGAEVTIEGQVAGVAPLDAMPVQLGTREVVVRHPELGERRGTVEVRFGEVTTLRIPLRDTASTPEDAAAIVAQ
jgi:hypothetical protein